MSLAEDLMARLRAPEGLEAEIEEMLAPLAARREQLDEELRAAREYVASVERARDRVDAVLKAGTTKAKKPRAAAANGKWAERLNAVERIVREGGGDLTTREVAARYTEIGQTSVSKALTELHKTGRIRKVAVRPASANGKGRTPVWGPYEENDVPVPA